LVLGFGNSPSETSKLDRDHIQFNMAHLLITFLTVLPLCMAQQVDDLVMVALLHRHGDRAPLVQTPVVTPSDYEKQWPLGSGELTALGANQIYALGQKFHQKYVSGGFLPARYHPHFYAGRSSDFHRTLQSASSFLYAVYPPEANSSYDLPGGFQPVPVSTVPKDEDKLLVIDWSRTCLAYTQHWEKVSASADYKSKQADSDKLFTMLKGIMGFQVTMDNAISVWDTLVCYNAHNYTSFKNVTDGMMAELTDVAEWVSAHQLVNKTVRLQISTWMTSLSQYLSSAANGTSTIKFAHFSGHDSTVMPALIALQLWDGKMMPYAAHIAVELHRTSDGKNYFVKVFVGGTEAGFLESPKLLPFCGNVNSCPLEKFQAYLATWDDGNLRERCDQVDHLV